MSDGRAEEQVMLAGRSHGEGAKFVIGAILRIIAWEGMCSELKHGESQNRGAKKAWEVYTSPAITDTIQLLRVSAANAAFETE